MSLTVTLPCSCGRLELRPEAIQITACEGQPHLTRYVFTCPRCMETRSRAASANVVAQLTSAGVRVVTWTLPAEILEPHTGPAIGYDDVLEFCLGLGRPDFTRELAA